MFARRFVLSSSSRKTFINASFTKIWNTSQNMSGSFSVNTDRLMNILKDSEEGVVTGSESHNGDENTADSEKQSPPESTSHFEEKTNTKGRVMSSKLQSLLSQLSEKEQLAMKEGRIIHVSHFSHPTTRAEIQNLLDITLQDFKKENADSNAITPGLDDIIPQLDDHIALPSGQFYVILDDNDFARHLRTKGLSNHSKLIVGANPLLYALLKVNYQKWGLDTYEKCRKSLVITTFKKLFLPTRPEMERLFAYNGCVELQSFADKHIAHMESEEKAYAFLRRLRPRPYFVFPMI